MMRPPGGNDSRWWVSPSSNDSRWWVSPSSNDSSMMRSPGRYDSRLWVSPSSNASRCCVHLVVMIVEWWVHLVVMIVDDEFHLVVMMVEKKTTTIHTTPGLLFKKSMTTDLMYNYWVFDFFVFVFLCACCTKNSGNEFCAFPPHKERISTWHRLFFPP